MQQCPFYHTSHILCLIRNIFVKDCQGALTTPSGHVMLVLTNQYFIGHYIHCFTMPQLRQKG